jgi:hypothetical protein
MGYASKALVLYGDKRISLGMDKLIKAVKIKPSFPTTVQDI